MLSLCAFPFDNFVSATVTRFRIGICRVVSRFLFLFCFIWSSDVSYICCTVIFFDLIFHEARGFMRSSTRVNPVVIVQNTVSDRDGFYI